MHDSTLLKLIRYATIREAELRRTNRHQRMLFVSRNPASFSEDDADMLVDCTSDERAYLFKKQPQLKPLYHEYRETPDKISGSFAMFQRRAWKHCGEVDSYKENWHHRALCTEYEDIASGKINKLIINQPPGTTKTTCAGVMFLAWRWTIDPGESQVYYSYNEEIPVIATGKFLTLITSDWYQRRWGHKFKLMKATDKTIRNSEGGWRLARGLGGTGTGLHPTYLFVDDPSKASDATNPNALESVSDWYSTEAVTRGILKNARHVVLHQRLATNDLTGFLLGETVGVEANEELAQVKWRHACVPMHYDPGHPYLYDKDPRKEKGQLLWPEVLSEEVVQEKMAMLDRKGQPNVAAQFEQNPRLIRSRLFGDMQSCVLKDATILPTAILQSRVVRAWDRGDSDDGDFTVGMLIACCDGVLYVLDVIRERVQYSDRDELIVTAAKRDRLHFTEYRVVSEQSPGPDGRSYHAMLSRRILKECGVACIAIPVSKNKVQRASTVASMAKSGIVRILGGKKWTANLLHELSVFPNGDHDDQVDALAHGQFAISNWEFQDNS